MQDYKNTLTNVADGDQCISVLDDIQAKKNGRPEYLQNILQYNCSFASDPHVIYCHFSPANYFLYYVNFSLFLHFC